MTGDKTNPAPMSEERLEELRRFDVGDPATWPTDEITLDELCAEVIRLRSGVGDEEVEEALHDIETWGTAYPTDIFPEPTKEQIDAMIAVTAPADGVSRVAAANARHLYKVRGPKLADLIRHLSASLAAERGAREKAEGDALRKACEAWEHCVGDPPEWESPLMDVWQAALMWSTELLAKRLNVTNYVAIDGSDSIEGDHGGTMMQVLIAAGLIDADTHESVSADLRARLGVARAEALEEAAKWHDQRAHDTPDAVEDELHRVSAAAIRALKDKDPSNADD